MTFVALLCQTVHVRRPYHIGPIHGDTEAGRSISMMYCSLTLHDDRGN